MSCIHSHRLRFVLWSFCVVLCLGALRWQWSKATHIDTNILSLLPSTEHDPVIERAIRSFTEHVGQKTIFLFGHSDVQKARRAAQVYIRTLLQSGLFKPPLFRIQQKHNRAFYDLYFPHRWSLVSQSLRKELQHPQGAQRWKRKVLQLLYGPTSSAFSPLLSRDPLLLFSSFVRELPSSPGKLRIHQGFMTLKRKKRTYIFAAIESKTSPFARSTQLALTASMKKANAAMRNAEPQTVLHSTGAIYFAQAAGASAEREMKTIGLGSLLGLLLLLLIVFRSLRPILLGGLPLAVGFLMAWTVCTWVFRQIHMLTLVFGASLIGVCIDYAFHYFSEQRMAAPDWTPAQGLRHILPGTTLGVITSVIGYLGLLLAPFPGLQQMAVFSSVGLVGAYATVLCWFPLLSGRQHKASTPWLLTLWMPLYHFWQQAKSNKTMKWYILGVIGLALPGLTQLKANDDVRQLYHADLSLKQQDQKIRKWIGSIDGSRFFLVVGTTPEHVLQREEQLLPHLHRLTQAKTLQFIQALSPFIPSLQLQKRNIQQLTKTFGASDRALELYMKEMGFSTQAIQSQTHALHSAEQKMLTVTKWLQHPASKHLRHLWLGKINKRYASIVMLGGVKKEKELIHIERSIPGVHYINKVDDVSQLFRRYRYLSSWLIALAYLCIFLLLVVRYTWKHACFILLPPVIAAIVALSAVGSIMGVFNLFHVLALLLVLGIGIDYTLFFAEAQKQWQATLLAILLSACTTLLSFGLLAWSETPLLRSFGLTVLFGMSTAFIFSPIAVHVQEPIEK